MPQGVRIARFRNTFGTAEQRQLQKQTSWCINTPAAEKTARTNSTHRPTQRQLQNKQHYKAETTAEQTTSRSQRKLRIKHFHERRENCGTNVAHLVSIAARTYGTRTCCWHSSLNHAGQRPASCQHRSSNTRHTHAVGKAVRTMQRATQTKSSNRQSKPHLFWWNSTSI